MMVRVGQCLLVMNLNYVQSAVFCVLCAWFQSIVFCPALCVSVSCNNSLVQLSCVLCSVFCDTMSCIQLIDLVCGPGCNWLCCFMPVSYYASVLYLCANMLMWYISVLCQSVMPVCYASVLYQCIMPVCYASVLSAMTHWFRPSLVLLGPGSN